LNFYLSPPEEIAIVGDPVGENTQNLLQVVYASYRPSKVVAVGSPSEGGEVPVPLLEGRHQVEGQATAYVCQHFACQQPVASPRALAELLGVHWEG
jgi:uncharacterized protein YyaL (SSP411 family)